MKRIVLFRCNGGHFFKGGACCPLDGWSSNESFELADLLARLQKEYPEPSFELLVSKGLSAKAISRTAVVDVGSDNLDFELLAPEGYIVSGKWVKLQDAGEAFH